MLQKDPAKRITIENLVWQPWIRERMKEEEKLDLEFLSVD